MRYFMFVCVDPAGEPYEPKEDNIQSWVSEMDKTGVRVMGNRLVEADKAVTVRKRKGKVLKTDARSRNQGVGGWLRRTRMRQPRPGGGGSRKAPHGALRQDRGQGLLAGPVLACSLPGTAEPDTPMPCRFTILRPIATAVPVPW